VAILKRISPAALSPAILLSLTLAAITFAITYDNGSYDLPSRNTLAIAVWWAVIVGVALRVFNTESVTKATLAFAGVLAALCAWTFASVFWAPSAENAFNEFNRVSLFLGVFVLVTIAIKREALGRWCDGLALAVTAITIVSLISRLFPGSFPDQGLSANLQSVAARLSFPTGYWNGLAVFVALGIPLLLRIAVNDKRILVPALAVAPIPAIVSVVVLASSRGGLLTVAVCLVVFFALTENRWRAAIALFCATLGSIGAVASLLARNSLVNGPLGSNLVERQGHTAALLVVLACLGAGTLFAASRLAAARMRYKPRPWLGWSVVALVILAVVVGAIASHPVRQVHAFQRSPATLVPISSNNFTSAHLINGRGSGRWQFWGSAIGEWEHHPVLGGGAGSFEEWWLAHRSFYYPIKDSHSLYIESLAELGVIGLLLTLGLAIGGISVGVRRSLRSSGEARVTFAALTAVFAGYSVVAGVDWMWELTAVTVVGLVALALLSTNAASSHSLHVAEAGEQQPARYRRFGLSATALIAVWLLICAQAIPLLAQLRLNDSHAAYDKSALADAYRAALDARNLQPWASSPYLQLAQVSEQEQRLREAQSWIEKAIKRDSSDWANWYEAARIEVKLGNAREAEKSLQRAVSLNRRSPLFSEFNRKTALTPASIVPRG
jgi:hypothetical protein